jgi:long-chain acyl-CoA synthetase
MSDGYFRIISRKKDTIIFGEYTVFPRDVEEVLYENPTRDGGGRRRHWPSGQRGAAGQGVRRAPRWLTLTKEELLALCRRRLEPYAVPWDIEFREELPKSFVGKVLRRLLVQPDE